MKSGKPFIVFNKDMRHATVAVCLALKHADKEIWLLSEKLDPVLYGSEWFLAEVADFLGRREGKMHILVESDLPDGHPIQQITAKHLDDGRLTIMRIPDDLREQYVYNYMVVDDMRSWGQTYGVGETYGVGDTRETRLISEVADSLRRG